MEGFEGFYEISYNGDIRNMRGLILKTYVINSGYQCLKLHKDGERTSVLVHRMVAFTFIDNDAPETKIEVNHKDGNKNNNHYSNLEWATSKENITHAFDLGLYDKVYTMKNTLGKKHKRSPTSKYHNVFWDTGKEKWSATIRDNCKNLPTICTHDEKEAAAYVNYLIDKYALGGRMRNEVDFIYKPRPKLKEKVKVDLFDLNNTWVRSFDTIKECANYFRVRPSTLQGKFKSGRPIENYYVKRNQGLNNE